MTKWEYLVIENREIGKLSAAIDPLGAAGWELVGFDIYKLIFKRPKA